ncbi:unnamed protein product [Rotaria magnacalcarata]|uniref:RNA helicase n=3 Tax=Rotaria magnacalcarata TaxID=392030 RepID=A0A819MYV2_9BILA|nr:unnamed protein product [Rotaria magnacalcarata]CAF1345790.1 unnamed protein product [Rotaria magnacalcarata]CAF1948241.1 unnamed protein product [Rotaria magnacalcarata]CAF2154761.1 unnamed protein product [Rotaria magnacalcarata]CAF2211763.1 unnamed protein product [Rotaria magnacalcarata]
MSQNQSKSTTNKYWKPGSTRPPRQQSSSIVDRQDSTSENVDLYQHSSMSIVQHRRHLPIAAYRTHILHLLEKYRTLIIIGETGSGKSTQIPQYLLESGWTRNGKLICMTEPRRIATIQLAQRIADEKDVVLGKEIGYRIRFEDVYSSGLTQILVMTEGLLLRELMYDPLLTRYNVIIIDEAHERSIQTDLLLGLLKKIQRRRRDLRLIITSATIDSERLRAFFEHQPTSISKTENQSEENKNEDEKLNECFIMSVEGRSYPVEIYHTTEPVPDYCKACVDTCIQIHENEKYNEQGDILCFISGQDDVVRIIRDLHDYARRLNDEQQHLKRKDERKKLIILPLYASLKFLDQMKVFEKTPINTRKIIVATNIAETSLTIPNIVYVIDCGYVRLKLFNPEFGFEVLTTLPITCSSALQRAGRAGRVRSGKAYRLYPAAEYEKMKEFQLPEIQRCDLALAVLQLKALGIHNIVRFDFPSPPPSKNLLQAIECLYALRAIDQQSHLTSDLGMKMAELPLHPAHARVLILSLEYGCTQEILKIIASLQVKHVFHSPPNEKMRAAKLHSNFACQEGDLITVLNVIKAFEQQMMPQQFCDKYMLNLKSLKRILEIKDSLEKSLRRLIAKNNKILSSSGDDVIPVLKCLTDGFFMNAAQLSIDGYTYRTFRGSLQELYIHPSCILSAILSKQDTTQSQLPKTILFNELIQSSKIFMSDITVIDPNWLYEIAGHYYEQLSTRQWILKESYDLE